MADTVEYKGGIGLPGLLTVLFVGLKLTGYISWPWLWVLSPLWISFGVAVVASLVILVIAAAVAKREF